TRCRFYIYRDGSGCRQTKVARRSYRHQTRRDEQWYPLKSIARWRENRGGQGHSSKVVSTGCSGSPVGGGGSVVELGVYRAAQAYLRCIGTGIVYHLPVNDLHHVGRFV